MNFNLLIKNRSGSVICSRRQPCRNKSGCSRRYPCLGVSYRVESLVPTFTLKCTSGNSCRLSSRCSKNHPCFKILSGLDLDTFSQLNNYKFQL